MSNGGRRNTATQSHGIRRLSPAARRRPIPLAAVRGARVRTEIRGHWVASVVLGVAVMVLGFVALGAIGFAALATGSALGRLLVLAGLMQTARALCVPRRGGFMRHLLAGGLSLIAGVLLLANPTASARALASIISASFMIGGIFRIVATCPLGFPGRHYALMSDIGTVVLGVLIGVEWPMSGAWAVGTFVGIGLIFDGWSLVMAGVAARELRRRPSRHLRLVPRRGAA